jgi:glutathione peroxidase-family protein
MAKIEVNGDQEHPVYHFLKSQKSSLGMKRIKWNFEKFLGQENQLDLSSSSKP